VGIVAVGGLWFVFSNHSPAERKQRDTELMAVLIPPPPPPPPPPQPEVKPMQDKPKMMDDSKPITPDDKPPDTAGAVTLGPGDKGTLAGGGHGNGLGGGGSRFGWYASQVDSTVKAAVEGNPKAHSGHYNLQVLIWPDLTGRITRAELVNSTGDPNVDDAIKNQVLIGLSMPNPPPSDMPLPIRIRVAL
jgi:hypothetical protein